MQICYSNFTYMSERKDAFKALEAFLVRMRNWDLNKKISWEKNCMLNYFLIILVALLCIH